MASSFADSAPWRALCAVFGDAFVVYKQAFFALGRLLPVSFTSNVSGERSARLAPHRLVLLALLAIVGGFITFGTLLILDSSLMDEDVDVPTDCGAFFKGTRAPSALAPALAPSQLWAAALKANTSDADGAGSLEDLRRCTEWSPPPGAADVDAVPERLIQLRCHAALVGSFGAKAPLKDRLALIEQAMTLLRGAEAAEQRCGALQQMLTAKRMDNIALQNPPAALGILGRWAAIDLQLQQAFDVVEATGQLLQDRMAAGDWDAQDAFAGVPSLRIRLRECSLRGSREVRLMTQQLPATPRVRFAETCMGPSLARMERSALAQGREDTDAGVLFGTGLLLSEVSMALPAAPFFREGSSEADLPENETVDAEGDGVPASLLLAEEFLQRGYETAAAPERVERAVMRTIQLCKHGTYLSEQKQLDLAPIERRFHAAAELAAENGRSKLAANALGKLSNLLERAGRIEDALASANKAMTHSDDPLASFQQARLRFELWQLQTAEEVASAAAQLLGIEAGRLNVEHDEVRLALGMHLQEMHAALESPGLQPCVALGDVATALACAFGKVFYG
eukprot:TRINITY_DN54767_c0_g1_i1.p1 TRINITY_DN54767_c0_g1~~TRINITY_DN54767_c0_g1_i1.p1  ORF type:complete len:568 (-),score=151.66 TRINITY_DN54767_c0_g1_i1:122-1825(-)